MGAWGREREREREREGERERILSRVHAQHRAWHGAWSHDGEIMTGAEIKSWWLHWLSHPGAPDFFSSNNHITKIKSLQDYRRKCYSNQNIQVGFFLSLNSLVFRNLQVAFKTIFNKIILCLSEWVVQNQGWSLIRFNIFEPSQNLRLLSLLRT